MTRLKNNVFNWISGVGSDDGFEPDVEVLESTDAPAGSHEKLSVLAKRAEMGLPLWHPRDRRKAYVGGDPLDD